MPPTLVLQGTPSASFRFALESASTASTGVSPCSTSQPRVSADNVVFPTPPFPVIAKIILSAFEDGCMTGTPGQVIHPAPHPLLRPAARQRRCSDFLAQLPAGFVQRFENEFGVGDRQRSRAARRRNQGPVTDVLRIQLGGVGQPLH